MCESLNLPTISSHDRRLLFSAIFDTCWPSSDLLIPQVEKKGKGKKEKQDAKAQAKAEAAAEAV